MGIGPGYRYRVSDLRVGLLAFLIISVFWTMGVYSDGILGWRTQERSRTNSPKTHRGGRFCIVRTQVLYSDVDLGMGIRYWFVYWSLYWFVYRASRVPFI